MFLGDVLEFIGGLAVTIAVAVIVAAAVTLVIGVGAGLLTLGVFLVYVAQGWADTPLSGNSPDEDA